MKEFSSRKHYFERKITRPLVRSYGDNATRTLSPSTMRIKCLRIFPEVYAKTSCPFSSITRNIPPWRTSLMVPSTSIWSSRDMQNSCERFLNNKISRKNKTLLTQYSLKNRNKVMKYFLCLFVFIINLSCISVSGDGNSSRKGRHNKFVSLMRPVFPKRLSESYYHSLYDATRSSGDCQPFCPQVEAWQYQYLGHVSPLPISTQKAFWRSPDEARVISFSLFGKEPMYYQGLLDFLKSFQTL